MANISLGYLGLSVSDPSAWQAYGRDFLGTMNAEPSANGVQRLRLDDYAWRLALEPGTADDLSYLGFEVAGPEDLAALRARLERAGVDVVTGSSDLVRERGVMELFVCKDPDGTRIEVFYGPTVVSHQPFASSQGVSFVTGEQGLGHVAIATTTDTFPAMRRFYLEALGFRQADTIRMAMGPELSVDLEFYYGNPRHHTLALAPLPMAVPKRLHHLMVQTETLDQVGHALDRAPGAGVEVTQTLGRHTNDKMVSFYCRTPSGFELEYGQGAIEVAEADWRIARHDRISSWGHKRV